MEIAIEFSACSAFDAAFAKLLWPLVYIYIWCFITILLSSKDNKTQEVLNVQ